MRVVYTCDAAYAPHLAVSVLSLAETNAETLAAVHLVTADLSEADISDVMRPLMDVCPVIVHRIRPLDLPPMPQGALAHVSPVTFGRFLAPRLVGGSGRLVYLDADTLILGSLADLVACDLDGAAVGAVVDQAMPRAHIRQLGMGDDAPYGNSGVLVIDLEAWHDREVEDRLWATLSALGLRARFADQDTLNVVFEGRWAQLPWECNAQRAYFEAGLHRQVPPVVVHFTGRHKPSRLGSSHPMTGAYWEVRRRTAWPRRTREDVRLRSVAWTLLTGAMAAGRRRKSAP